MAPRPPRGFFPPVPAADLDPDLALVLFGAEVLVVLVDAVLAAPDRPPWFLALFDLGPLVLGIPVLALPALVLPVFPAPVLATAAVGDPCWPEPFFGRWVERG